VRQALVTRLEAALFDPVRHTWVSVSNADTRRPQQTLATGTRPDRDRAALIWVHRELARSNEKELIMRRLSRMFAVLGPTVAVLVVTAGPAGAAGTPDANATCLAEVFQAQAVSAPRTVSNRILEIRELYLQGAAFGQVLQPLAHDLCE
jgi:hypothetical protein